jgi:hypothetical protein
MLQLLKDDFVRAWGTPRTVHIFDAKQPITLMCMGI